MYRVYRRIQNGELVHVSSPESLEQAAHLVEALYIHWPGEYVVRDSEGNDVRLPERAAV
jgi:hypothetical protein